MTEDVQTGPPVAIIMGSDSDVVVMKGAYAVLDELGVGYEARVVSAHRMPEDLFEFAKSAKARGVKVIIAAAGGAAHLPGMTAALAILPVLGVPIPSSSNSLNDIAALLSMTQMPSGVPVATFAVGSRDEKNAGARNTAQFAALILSLSDPQLAERLKVFRDTQTATARAMSAR